MTRSGPYLLRLLRPSLAAIGLTSAAFMTQALLGLPTALLLKRLFDATPAGWTQPLFWVGGVIGLYLVADGLGLWATDRNLRLTKTAILGLREHLFDAVYSQPRTHEPAAEAARLQAALVQDVERVDDFSNVVLSRFVPALLSATVLFVVLACLDWRLFLVALAVVPAAWGLTLLVRRVVRHRTDRFHAVMEDFSALSMNAIRRLPLTRIHDAQGPERAKLRRQLEILRDAGHDVAWINGLLGVVQLEVATLSGLAVLVVGRALILGGTLSFGGLIAFYVILAMARTQLSALMTSIPSLIGGLSAFERLDRLIVRASPPPYQGRAAHDFQGGVVLQDVTFGYDGRRLLDRVNLKAPPGEITALAGPNGAGKTTLVRLVLGLERPISGKLLADGVDYDRIDLAMLRAQVGIALQDPLIFPGSLRDNLLFGLADPPDDRVLGRALSAAGADALLERLPEGLETWVGDGGERLSGGERQRLSLARAILRRPRLLILDEPANHLGAAETLAIIDRFRRLQPGAAILVISHDAQVLGAAHNIFHLDQGMLTSGRDHRVPA